MGPMRWFVVVFSLAVASPALAQVTTADLVGRVSDSSGAVLPGATVILEHDATHDVRTIVAGSSGDYIFSFLPIGAYTVKVELQGFASQTTKVNLSTGDRVRFDPKLQVGTVAENITVLAETPLLQTDTATVGTLVSERAVQDAPMSGRNFVRLVHDGAGRLRGPAQLARQRQSSRRPPSDRRPSRSTAPWTTRTIS